MGNAIINQKDEVVINDLIFKELIKRGYSLEGNTRVWNIADSKLWYLTPEQAQAYLDLEDSDNFKDMASNEEFELLSKHIKEIKDAVNSDSMNIVDLGCGDGKKAAFIVENIGKGMKIRYCPIDISGYMVEKAIETFSKLEIEEILDLKYNISDFENLENIVPLLVKEEFKNNLFVMLGHTLGNFEINELLYEVRSSMKDGDVFIAISGIENKKWENWSDSAKDEEKLNMNNFFMHIPTQLGLTKQDVEFGARFRNQRIEYYYILKENKTINFQDKEVQFKEGDQIIVATAYKHNKDDLLTYLNMYFKEVEIHTSEDKSTFLTICKK